MTTPAGLHRADLTPTDIDGVLATLFGHTHDQLLPAPFDTASWLIADLSDGRLTGRRAAGQSGWELGHHAFPDDAPAPPATDQTGRIQQIRVFTSTAEIIISDNASRPRGWLHTATPDPTEEPLHTRHRRFLLGPRLATVTRHQGFSRLDSNGTILVLPIDWQPPTLDPHDRTLGSWLHIAEHFAGNDTTGVVGVAHTRYTDLTVDSAAERNPSSPEEATG